MERWRHVGETLGERSAGDERARTKERIYYKQIHALTSSREE